MPSPDADVGLLDPLWAGRPVASVTSDTAIVAGMLRFESKLAEVCAPEEIAGRVAGALRDVDAGELAVAARDGGNPVIPLLATLRGRLDAEAAAWLHKGATSQDALDTALVLVAQLAARVLVDDAAAATRALADAAEEHAALVITGRTLTQPATPTTLGLKLAGWSHSVAEAARAVHLAALALPLQLGGAAGTLAAFDAAGLDGRDVSARLAAALGLADPVAPWHVHRAPITRLGDALVQLCDALGTVGRNVAALARVGEVDDGAAGGSSTMPHKANPVRAVLLTSAAVRAPFLGATLHAAAVTVDERPDGAWHAEWSPFRELLRVAGGAAAVGRELSAGLRVHPDVIAANVAAHADDLLAERARFADGDATPADYLGSAGVLTARLVAAARSLVEDL